MATRLERVCTVSRGVRSLGAHGRWISRGRVQGGDRAGAGAHGFARHSIVEHARAVEFREGEVE